MGIDAAIAASRAHASSFTRSLFDEDRWDAQQVVDFVNERRSATVSTVSSTGQPHAGVVIAASVDDEIYFTVHPASVLARNLQRNDRMALTVSDGRHATMSQGRAVRVGAAVDETALIQRLAATTPSGRFTPDGWDGDVYRIEMRRLVANRPLEGIGAARHVEARASSPDGHERRGPQGERSAARPARRPIMVGPESRSSPEGPPLGEGRQLPASG